MIKLTVSGNLRLLLTFLFGFFLSNVHHFYFFSFFLFSRYTYFFHTYPFNNPVTYFMTKKQIYCIMYKCSKYILVFFI